MSLHSRKKAGFPIKLFLDQVIDLIPFYNVQCALFDCITSFYMHPLNASCLPGIMVGTGDPADKQNRMVPAPTELTLW